MLALVMIVNSSSELCELNVTKRVEVVECIWPDSNLQIGIWTFSKLACSAVVVPIYA